jgi:hypothetical protein
MTNPNATFTRVISKIPFPRISSMKWRNSRFVPVLDSAASPVQMAALKYIKRKPSIMRHRPVKRFVE